MGLLGDLVDAAGDAISDGVDAVGDAVDGAVDLLEDAGDALADLAEDVVDAVGDIAEDLIDAIGDFAQDLIDQADDVFDVIGDLAQAAIDGVADFVEGAIASLGQLADEAWENAVGAAERAWEQMQNVAEEVWEATASAVERGWEAIAAGAESAWHRAAEAAEFVYEQAARTYERAVEVAERTLLWLGDLIKDIAYAIAMLGACLAGILIHNLAEADNVMLNVGKRFRTLPQAFREEARAIFPDIPYEKVFFMENSALSANHFSDDTSAMTFMAPEVGGVNAGYLIWLRGTFDPNSNADKGLMIHELTHVEQYRRFRFEDAFACAYGIGYADAGFSYENNPLESQAFDVQDVYLDSLTP